jgi:hypothetical protein
LQLNQEVMGQDHQGHVMMPAAPEAAFIVVQPQFILALGEAALDRPAHATGPDQGDQRQVVRGVGEIALGDCFLPRRGHTTADHQPDGRSGQSVAHGDHPHGHEVGQQGVPWLG